MSVYTYWVYLIAGINCIYSFCDWTINLKSDPFEIALLWIGMYTVNIGLNILVAVRYYFEDRFPILIWLAYTIPVFIIRMTCMTYRKLRHSTTIYVCIVNAYIFMSCFVMWAAYKYLAQSVVNEGPASGQVGWNLRRGLRFTNPPPPPSTRYQPRSPSPYATDIPSAPVFVEDSNMPYLDISASNNCANSYASDGGKCESKSVTQIKTI